MSSTDIARKIAGDNSRLGRADADFYPTPPSATSALLQKETFIGSIWEPACGKGDISDVLIRHGYEVKSSDLNDYGYGDSGINFLDPDIILSEKYQMVDNIITNPPFNMALEFVERSKIFAEKKIAMFLKTAFLEGAKRYTMFQDRDFALRSVYQFSKRVNFRIHAGTHKNGGMIPFAWFVWEKGYVGRPTIEWINPNE